MGQFSLFPVHLQLSSNLSLAPDPRRKTSLNATGAFISKLKVPFDDGA